MPPRFLSWCRSTFEWWDFSKMSPSCFALLFAAKANKLNSIASAKQSVIMKKQECPKVPWCHKSLAHESGTRFGDNRVKRSERLYRGRTQVALDPWGRAHTWLMTDGTCYARFWQQVSGKRLLWLIARWYLPDAGRKEPETRPQKAQTVSFAFLHERKQSSLLLVSSIDFVIKRPCRYFAHPSNFIRFATAY